MFSEWMCVETRSVFCSGSAVIQEAILSFSVLLCSNKQNTILHAMLNRAPQMTQVMNLRMWKPKNILTGIITNTQTACIRNWSQPGQLTIMKGQLIKMIEGFGGWWTWVFHSFGLWAICNWLVQSRGLYSCNFRLIEYELKVVVKPKFSSPFFLDE